MSSFSVSFSSCPQSFPASGSFQMKSALHISGRSIGSFSFNIGPSNEHSGLISFRMDGLVSSPCNPRDSQESSPTPQFKSINSSLLSFLYSPTLTSLCDYWKNHSSNYMNFCRQSDVWLLNMLSRFVITFLLRSKHLLISWLQSPSAVILEPPKIKSDTVSLSISLEP